MGYKKVNVLIIVSAVILVIGIFALGDVSGMASKRIPITGCRLSMCQDVSLDWNGVTKQGTSYYCGSQVVKPRAPIGRTTISMLYNNRRPYTLILGKTLDLDQMRITLKEIIKNKPIANHDTIKLRVCPPVKTY